MARHLGTYKKMRIKQMRRDGKTLEEIAHKLGVALSTVSRVTAQVETLNETETLAEPAETTIENRLLECNLPATDKVKLFGLILNEPVL